MYHLRMPEEGKSCFSTCFLSILPLQKAMAKQQQQQLELQGISGRERCWDCAIEGTAPLKDSWEPASPAPRGCFSLSSVPAAKHRERAYLWDSRSCPLQPHRLRLINLMKVHLNYRENTFTFLFNHRCSFSPSQFLEHNFLTGYKPYLCS